MKNPTMLFALIALAAGIVASGFTGVRTIDGEMLSSSLTHQFEEQGERVLPAFAHADTNITVALRSCSASSVATRLDRNPTLISGRPSISRSVPVFRFVYFSDSTLLALSRAAASEIACRTNGFVSAVTPAIPELRSSETQSSPLAESLAGQINDPILVSTVATHGRLALGEIRAEQLLLNSAIASAKPVLADDVRNDGVLAKSFASEIHEPFRACHLMSPWEEYLSGTHGRYTAT